MHEREIELSDTLWGLDPEKGTRSFKMFDESINFSYDTRPQEFIDANLILSDEKEQFKKCLQDVDGTEPLLLSQKLLIKRFSDAVLKKIITDDTSYNQAMTEIANANRITDANMIKYNINKISIMWFIRFNDILKSNGA